MITNNVFNNLKRKINKRGSRLTRQRLMIISYLQGVTSHPTAEMVYRHIKKHIPNISLGTVYRNLKYLSDNGFALQLNTGDGKYHFDGNNETHFHFICGGCNKIYDIWDKRRIPIRKTNLIKKIYRIECNIFGVCKKCKI